MKILIGYDGTDYSNAAIEDLRLAGLPDDSDALVVSVADLLMRGPTISEVLRQAVNSSHVEAGLKKAHTHAERITREAEEAAKRGEERLRKLFPQWNVRAELMIGTPEWVLIDVAEKWNADLVVVGSLGRSAFQRLFLGSVSKRVVTDSHSSVRVARRRNRRDADAPPRIIVGVDGSPTAERAVFEVGRRVWPEGTEVRLIAVDDSIQPHSIATRLPQSAAMINEYSRNRASRVSSMLDWAAKELSAIGLRTSSVTDKGDAKSVLLAQANEWDADSIFVGTRDFKSGFERFRLGSVSTAVVAKAMCSVEVVRNSTLERSAGVAANGAAAG